jgi:hypothetical protein
VTHVWVIGDPVLGIDHPPGPNESGSAVGRGGVGRWGVWPVDSGLLGSPARPPQQGGRSAHDRYPRCDVRTDKTTHRCTRVHLTPPVDRHTPHPHISHKSRISTPVVGSLLVYEQRTHHSMGYPVLVTDVLVPAGEPGRPKSTGQTPHLPNPPQPIPARSTAEPDSLGQPRGWSVTQDRIANHPHMRQESRIISRRVGSPLSHHRITHNTSVCPLVFGGPAPAGRGDGLRPSISWADRRAWS